MSLKHLGVLVGACGWLALPISAAAAQQAVDPTFDVSVARPALAGRSPVLRIDEAHANFHTMDGRYAPFARLAGNDGFRVGAHRAVFDAASLRGIDVLVIANAGPAGSSTSTRSAAPAFTDAECDAVAEWVRAGGSLLLVADHAPFGSSAAAMARRFGVEFGEGWVLDSALALAGHPASVLAFSGSQLGRHPILSGRADDERIERVVAFTGQSLSVPANASPLLLLSAGAVEQQRPSELSGSSPRPVGGRAQAVAMPFGRGRVVMLGEASMLTAQLIPGRTPAEPARPMGMNVAGYDNKQFALNVLRWLAGSLDPQG